MDRKQWLQMIIPALESTLRVIKIYQALGCTAASIAYNQRLITFEQYKAVGRVIQASLQGYSFFGWWLRDHNPPANTTSIPLDDRHMRFTAEEEHNYRVLWFEQMIRDYKEMLANEP